MYGDKNQRVPKSGDAIRRFDGRFRPNRPRRLRSPRPPAAVTMAPVRVTPTPMPGTAATEMPRRPWWRRGLVIGLLLTVLPLAVLSGVMTRDSIVAQREAEQERLRGLAETLADAVDAELGALLLMARTLSLAVTLDDASQIENFTARARDWAALFGGMVAVIGPPPDHVLIHVSEPALQPWVPRPMVPETLDALRVPLAEVFEHGLPAVSDYFVGAVMRRPGIAVGAPVDRAGQDRRAVALIVHPARIQAVVNGVVLPAGGFAGVADSRRVILAQAGIRGQQDIGRPGPDWLKAAMTGRRSGFATGPDLDGVQALYAFRHLSTAPGWSVVVGQPLRAQAGAARQAVGWLALGFVAVIAGGFLVLRTERNSTLRAVLRETEALKRGRAEVEELHGGLPALIHLSHVSPDGSSRRLYRGGDIEGVTGWPAAEVATWPSLEGHAADGDRSRAAHLQEALTEGSSLDDWSLRQPDGSWRAMHTTSRLLRRLPDGSGLVVGYTLDVTAERQAEARALAAARLASLGELAAGLAHEIKQPLQTISLAVENAKFDAQRSAWPGVTSRLERIGQQAMRAGDVIEKLRRFALGSDTASPPQPLCLRDALDGALVLAGHALDKAGVELSVDIGTPPLCVMADRTGLEQVLVNLLTNARDALAQKPPGQRRAVSILATPAARGTVALRVSDTGGGIPAGVMERVFEPFVTTKTQDQGTGLGLSICRGIVVAMGGAIAVENGPEGAVFTITLPAAPPEG